MQAFTPAWTSLSPLSFVEAAKAGAAIGQQIKEAQQRNDLGYYGINSENNRAASELAAKQSMFAQGQQSEQQQLNSKIAAQAAAQQLEEQLARDKMIQELGLTNRALDVRQSAIDTGSETAAGRLQAEQDRTNALLGVGKTGRAAPLSIEDQAANAAAKKLMQDSYETGDTSKMADAANLLNRNRIVNPGEVTQYEHNISLLPFSGGEAVNTGVKSDIQSPALSPAQKLSVPQQTIRPTAALTPEQKAAKANQIAAENPTLSREEILALVNKL